MNKRGLQRAFLFGRKRECVVDEFFEVISFFSSRRANSRFPMMQRILWSYWMIGDSLCCVNSSVSRLFSFERSPILTSRNGLSLLVLVKVNHTKATDKHESFTNGTDYER